MEAIRMKLAEVTAGICWKARHGSKKLRRPGPTSSPAANVTDDSKNGSLGSRQVAQKCAEQHVAKWHVEYRACLAMRYKGTKGESHAQHRVFSCESGGKSASFRSQCALDRNRTDDAPCRSCDTLA